jgi:hypothetical protein
MAAAGVRHQMRFCFEAACVARIAGLTISDQLIAVNAKRQGIEQELGKRDQQKALRRTGCRTTR